MVKIPHISGVLRTTLIASALLVGSTAFAAITVGLSTTGQSVDITYSKLTLNTPVSVASGDLLLATVAIKNGTTGVITAPSGWTLIRRTDKTTDVSLATYYHIANSSEPSSYGWDISPNTHASGGITRYSGVDPVLPIDVSAGNSGHSTTASAPSVTTLHDGDRLIAVFAARGGSNAGNFSTVAGMTEEYDTGYSPNGPSVSLQDMAMATSGATGVKNSSLTNAGQDWVAQTITLNSRPVTTGISFVNAATARVASPNTTLSLPNFDAATSSLILVFVTNWTGAGDVFTDVTFNGQSMTRISGASGLALGGTHFEAVYYITGQSGVHDVVVSTNQNTDFWAAAAAYAGTNQIGSPIGEATLNNVNVFQSSLQTNMTTSSSTGSWVVSYAHTAGEMITGFGPGVVRNEINPYFEVGDSDSPVQGVFNYTNTWSANNPTAWMASLVEITAQQ